MRQPDIRAARSRHSSRPSRASRRILALVIALPALVAASPSLAACRVTSVVTGLNHTLGLLDDSSVWITGNFVGGSSSSKVPVPVPFLGPASAISAGEYASHVVLPDGSVWAWGTNSYGELGDGTRILRAKAVPILGLPPIQEIGCVRLNGVALAVDGTVWGWGSNEFGQVGDGTTIDRLSPVQVKNLDSIVAISTGLVHSLALRADGTVWG